MSVVVRRLAALLSTSAVVGALAVAGPAAAATATLSVARTPSQVSLGHSFTISGAVTPFKAGETVQLQQFYNRAWHTVSSPKVDAKGTYLFAVKAAKTGVYTYRVAAPANSAHPALMTGSFKTPVYFVSLESVHFLPNGDKNLNDEWVVLRNSGTIAVDLRGWLIAERVQSLAFVLPSYTLAPGASVMVHDGKGTSGSGHVYLGSTKRVWSAVHDTASLYTLLRLLDVRRAW